MDSSISRVFAASIESVINAALRYDPASMQKVAEINAVLAVELTSPALTFYCSGTSNGIYVTNRCALPVTTKLKGTPLGLAALLKKPTTLANSGVELTGSVGLLQRWQALLNGLDIDWEDAISNTLGDMAGPIVAKTIIGGLSWTKLQSAEQTRLFKEYITEELKITPSKAELKVFNHAVNEMKMDTERLQARVSQLLSRHAFNNNKSTKTNKKDNKKDNN